MQPIVTPQKVFESAQRIAPQFRFDPLLIYALGEQECEKDPVEKLKRWLPGVARLEQGYYRRYVNTKFELATTSEVLLAASYGVWQMMGLSLLEAGYFIADWALQSDRYRELHADPLCTDMNGKLSPYLSETNIPKAINRSLVNLDSQAQWACIWLESKRKAVGGDPQKFLQAWNGGGNPHYADEVLARYDRVKSSGIPQ